MSSKRGKKLLYHKMNKYAVCGMGFIFPRHKEAIQKTGGKIILTCDIDPEKKADYIDYKEMLESPRFADVDTVSVLVPNYLHAEICRAVLAKGKQVLCEKPLTIFDDYEGLEDVNVVLQLRHNPEVIGLKKKQKSANIDIYVKTYREPEYFESWKGKPELSGGILYNMGVHYIDLLLHLLGEPVEIRKTYYTDKQAYGEILFERGKGTYYVELSEEWCPTIRRLTYNGLPLNIEGATIPLKGSEKVINLHTRVYEEMLKGNTTKLDEARKSLDLIKKLK